MTDYRTERNNNLGLRVVTMTVPEESAVDLLMHTHMVRCDYLVHLAIHTPHRHILESMALRNRAQKTPEALVALWDRLHGHTADQLRVTHRLAEQWHATAMAKRESYRKDALEWTRYTAEAYAHAQRQKAARDLLNQLLEKEKPNA